MKGQHPSAWDRPQEAAAQQQILPHQGGGELLRHSVDPRLDDTAAGAGAPWMAEEGGETSWGEPGKEDDAGAKGLLADWRRGGGEGAGSPRGAVSMSVHVVGINRATGDLSSTVAMNSERQLTLAVPARGEAAIGSGRFGAAEEGKRKGEEIRAILC